MVARTEKNKQTDRYRQKQTVILDKGQTNYMLLFVYYLYYVTLRFVV